MRRKNNPKRVIMTMLLCAFVVFGIASAANEPLEIYVTTPISKVKILPDTDPASLPGSLSNTIPVVATPGEYEPASFIVRPAEEITSLKVEATDLKKDDGSVIPASNIDIKSVKCWYQARGAWKTIHRLSYKQVLVPELLLNDDTLIKVDTEEKKNHIRLTYPAGDKYVWISREVENNDLDPHNKEIHFSAPGIGPTVKEEFTLKDSPTLLPVDVPAKTNKQFWLTIKVPQNTKPGDYTGTISLSSVGKPLGALTLKLTVLPFKLSEPRTFYNPNKEFTSSIYYRGVLDPAGKGAVFGGQLPDGTTNDIKSEEQFLAELKNMYDHGVTRPNFCLPYGMIKNNKQCFKDMLWLRKEAGITGPYYMIFDLMMNQQQEAELREMKDNIKKLFDIIRVYGIPGFYLYAIDETTGDLLKSQRAAWNAAHEMGAKVVVAGFKGTFEDVGDILDLFVCNGKPEKELARKWHSVGHEIWCYAYPQGGVENPEIYRRNFGLLLWKAEYDGAATYCYQTESGSWNDLNDIMRDLTFAYPTSNGVVDTIAWEGYREAIDDIRYGSTLKLEIAKARNSADEQKKVIADNADNFLESLDVAADFDDNRAKIIEYIIQLVR